MGGCPPIRVVVWFEKPGARRQELKTSDQESVVRIQE
jgi:hypothetical protein